MPLAITLYMAYNLSKERVITCSDKNPADQYVLQILEKYGSKTYLTSKGNVEVTSDGKNIKIFQ